MLTTLGVISRTSGARVGTLPPATSGSAANAEPHNTIGQITTSVRKIPRGNADNLVTAVMLASGQPLQKSRRDAIKLQILAPRHRKRKIRMAKVHGRLEVGKV
jgi:hypothetical protein